VTRGFAGNLTIQHLLGAIDEREGLVAQALAAYASVWRAQEPDISVEVPDVRGEAALVGVGCMPSRRHGVCRSTPAPAAELGADPVTFRPTTCLRNLMRSMAIRRPPTSI
jgi:hypothetical protein